MGYKNAPHIEPKIGDRVYCGPSPDTAVVTSIAHDPNSMVVNCAVNDCLHLNVPEEARLYESVDGFKP